MQSVKRSPDFQFQRLVTANETGPFTEGGINLRGYKSALIQVVPVVENALDGGSGEGLTPSGSTSDPEIAVYSWNAALGVFVEHNPASVLTGRGAGVAYEFKVDAEGQTIYVAVTNGVTGGEGVAIYAAGFEAIEASC